MAEATSIASSPLEVKVTEIPTSAGGWVARLARSL
jgi:hypothetical protein